MSQADEGSRRRRIAVWIAGGVAAVAWLALAASWWFVCDDAWISFRYAWQLAHGRGLVFNPGATPPVEGYSNLLWVLLAAGGLVAGVAPDRWLPVLSLACGLALVVSTGWIGVRRLGLGPWGAWAASALVASAPSVVVWSTGGLATLPAALALLWLVEGWLLSDDPRGAWRGALAGALLVLLRVEGVGWVIVVAAMAWLGWGHRRPRDLGGALAAVGAVFAAVAAFRGWYFGAWMANAAQAKLSAGPGQWWRGVAYIVGFVAADPVRGLLAVAAGIHAVRRSGTARAVALMALGPFAYAVVVGGDFMAFGRLIVPAVPFLALVGAAGIATRPVRIALPAAALGVVLGLMPLGDAHLVPRRVRAALDVRHNSPRYRSEAEQWAFMADNADRWADTGRALAQVTAPGDTYVTGAVGAVGYHAPDLVLLDRFGLVSREVAERPARRPGHTSPGHDRVVALTFFLDREPTLMGAEIARDRSELRLLPAVARGRMRTVAPDQYAPELHPVRLRGKRAWVLVHRRQGDRAAADAAWTAWERRVPKLLRGRPGSRPDPGGDAAADRSAPPSDEADAAFDSDG